MALRTLLAIFLGLLLAMTSSIGAQPDVMELVTQTPVKGAFHTYHPRPTRDQFQMPLVTWRGMAPDDQIRSGALVTVLQTFSAPVLAFIVEPMVDGDYWLWVTTGEGSTQIPIIEPLEYLPRSFSDSYLVPFLVDADTEFESRRYVGEYSFGLWNEFDDCDDNRTYIFSTTDAVAAAQIKEAELGAVSGVEGSYVYVELFGRRLGEFIGPVETGQPDSQLHVDQIVRYSKTDLCASR